MSNYCKECYKKQEQIEQLQAENFEFKESLKVFQRPDITKILTLYKVGDIELLEQKCDKLQAENEELKEYKTSKENSYQNLQKEWQQCKWDVRKLTTENERLKEKIIKLSEEKGHLIVENNTLKETNKSLSMLGTDLASANETVRKEFFRADKNKDMWREKTEKLQQTLQEIRELMHENDNIAGCEYCYGDIRYSILDKINEVVGVE